MKTKILLITAFLISSAWLLNAQDKKKIQIKMIKSENGENLALDTIFESTEHNDVYFYSHGKISQEEIDSILKSLDIDAKHGVKFISENLGSIDSEKIKHIWISATGDDEFDIDKHAIIEMMDEDKIIETTDEFTILNGDSVKINKEYIYHSGGEKVYIKNKDGNKVIVSASANSGSSVWNVKDSDVKVITITDDMDVDVDAKGHVKIISRTSSEEDSHGISEIIIKKGDSDCKIIEVFVNEDDFDGEHNLVEIEEALEGIGEKVKIVKYKTDDGKYVVKAEITDSENTDKKQINKELKKIKIYPNPTDGKFNLEFELSSNESVIIIVKNEAGKSVNSKKVKKFTGKFSGEIDISKEDSGTYIIQVIQGDKTIEQKLQKK